jgi:hypothetical protein
LFGVRNKYSSVYLKRRRKRRNLALLVILITGLLALGVFFNPFLDTTGRYSNRDPLTGQSGYSLGGTPLPLEPAKRGGWPSLSVNSSIFLNDWERLDGPVKSGRVVRGYSYGYQSGPDFLEQYINGPQNMRPVIYWDKARMQLDPTGKILSLGALATELISGQVRLGDREYLTLEAPDLPILGAAEPDNPAPTYSTLASVVTLKTGQNSSEKQTGLTVTATLNRQGQVGSGTDEGLGIYGITNTYYAEKTGHNIPGVFWEYLNSMGIINERGQFQTDKLFVWSFQFGQPISEPFWIKAKLDGQVQVVLIQVFENQILYYNPPDGTNPEAVKVEGVDIGRHYYTWRYPGAAFLNDNRAGSVPGTGGANSLRLVLGDEGIMRSITLENGRMTRNLLVNRQTGQVYTDTRTPANVSGFMLELDGPNNVEYQISGDSFNLNGYSLPVWEDKRKIIELKGQFPVLGETLELKLYYQLVPGRNYIEKWLKLEPNPRLANLKVRLVSLEDVAVSPKLRPAALTPDNEMVPLQVPVEKTSSVPGRAFQTDVLAHESGDEGLYYFSATPLGGEYYVDNRVVVIQEDYQSLEEGFLSGRAVTGVFRGKVDLGIKRYLEYLDGSYSRMSGKQQPVWYSTWYPFTNNINAGVLMPQLDKTIQLGFYDVFHIDAGWENDFPLQVDTQKFPQGLKPFADKTTAANMSLGLWINPFSNSYERYVNYRGMHKQHPEWHIKGLEKKEEGRDYTSGPFGINTNYYNYVRERLLDLVKNNNVRVLYWDGADWNIPDSQAPGLSEKQRRIEWVKGTKRLMALTDELRQVRPDIVIVAWNSTANVHLLGAVEQLQLSDNWELPLGISELARHKQFFGATYHLPYYAIWGDWYGLTYSGNADKNLELSPDTLKYALTSMIGSGAINSGASLDLTRPLPGDLLTYMQKLYGWRKKFEDYFKVYQHIFDSPSENAVYGEAHVVSGQGFLILNNPTNQELPVALPLNAPELELDPNRSYKLYDWTSLTGGVEIGTTRPGEGVTVKIPPRSVKIIGLEIGAAPLS